jgi:hypothetical protein
MLEGHRDLLPSPEGKERTPKQLSMSEIVRLLGDEATEQGLYEKFDDVLIEILDRKIEAGEWIVRVKVQGTSKASGKRTERIGKVRFIEKEEGWIVLRAE